jgi:hypothetical protein
MSFEPGSSRASRPIGRSQQRLVPPRLPVDAQFVLAMDVSDTGYRPDGAGNFLDVNAGVGRSDRHVDTSSASCPKPITKANVTDAEQRSKLRV